MNYFFLVFSTFFFLLNFFVIRKTLKYVVPSDKNFFFLVFFLSLILLFYLYRFFGSYFSYSLNKFVSYIIYYYLAFLIYASMLFIFASIFTMIFRYKLNLNLYKVSLILVPIILLAGTFFKHHTIIKEYDIKLDKNYDMEPLNIVLVSDIHLGYINGNSSFIKMKNIINSLNPDIVLIAGDLIDMNLEPVMEKNMLKELSDIKTKYGIYFALGNHDIYGKKAALLTETLTAEGVTVLRDEKILVNDGIYIAGRDNFSKKPLKDIIGEHSDKPVILIQHTPDTIEETVENKIDLQVSGHTHKGQFFPGNLFTKRIFLIDYGHKKISDTNILVSSGYGTWGPPIRIGSSSEICLIKFYN